MEVVGNSLIWLGHNSFFLQLAGKRLMIDPVYGSIPFVKRRSQFPADPSIFRQIDYLLISHDHFDHLDKPSVARLVADNPQLKLFCGLNTGALIKSWFPNLEVIEAASLDFFTCTALEQAWCERWRRALVGLLYDSGRWYYHLQ